MTMALNAIAQGLLWSLMGIGLYISFRILNFADLTSEASFGIGVVTAVHALEIGWHPVAASLLALVAGGVAGLVTGLLITKLKIHPLLAGIISLTGFYSINLRILGQANVSLRKLPTLYSLVKPWFGQYFGQRVFVALIAIACVLLVLQLLFVTDLGQAIIATGDNEVMAQSLGIHTKRMKRLALILSNAIIALCGALVAQDSGFGDVNLGAGTVVVALSAIVISEVLFSNLKMTQRFVSIAAGSIIYRLLLVLVMQLGFHPSDFRLLSALVLTIFLAIPSFLPQRKANKGASK